MRNGRRRRSSSFEKPWVAYAAIGGIVVVIILALVFYLGGGGSPAAPAKTGTTGATPTGSGTSGSGSGQASAGTTPTLIIATPTPVTVPDSGVYVKVSYLGGFSGTYGIPGAPAAVRSSGDRIFPVENATGTVTASFHKEDRSTTHEIDVEIWKNGKALTFGRNQSAFGVVSISAAV